MTNHRKTLIQKAAYALVYLAGLTWLALSLRADKLDTTEYWEAYAYRHAAGKQFEASLTAEQRQMRESMNKAAQQIAAERAKLSEACKAIGQELDETGQQPVCKAKSVK